MGYKGHPGWTDADVGNVPDTNPTLECEECGVTERWEDLKPASSNDWQLSNSPEKPVLCPDCRAPRSEQGVDGVCVADSRRRPDR